MKDIAKLIQEFCQAYEYGFRSSYSGRGMYGATCVAMETDADTTLFKVGLELGAYAAEQGVEAYDIVVWLEKHRTDSMGLGSIIYFPDITA